MRVIKGLLAITRNHKVRTLSIIYKDRLFTIQSIADTNYICFCSKNKIVPITEGTEKYINFLRAFIGLIHYISELTKSRYYTFMGEYRYSFDKETLRYEPYVDLFKKVIVKIDRKKITINTGEVLKKLKKTRSGYGPVHMINVLNEVFNRLINLA